MKVRNMVRGGAIVALSLGLASLGTGMGLTAAHSPSKDATSSPTVATAQTASGSAASPDLTVGGGGGGDSYTVIEVPGYVLAGIPVATVSGSISLVVAAVCGATAGQACPFAISAAIGYIDYLVGHLQFPNVYIWWNDTTWSLSGITTS